MKKTRSKLSKELKIGIFGVATLAILVWGINFLKGADIFSYNHKYYAVYDHVNGLQASASVLIKGYKVGSITDITYDPNTSENVIIELSVRSKYRIPVDSRAKVFSDGIMGSKAVEILLGQSDRFLNPGDTLFSAKDRDFLEVAGNEFEYFKQKFGAVVGDISTTLELINTLLKDNSGNIEATLANMASATSNLNEILDSEKGSLKQTFANLGELSSTLNGKSEQIGNIIDNFESFSDSLSLAQLSSTICRLNEVITGLNRTVETINSNEGTVGRLINDQTLYQELLGASENLNTLLEDIKANPQKYVNISVFGRRNN